MKRLQEPTNANRDPKKDISSGSKSVSRKRKRKLVTIKEKRSTEYENVSDNSDFDDMSDQVKIRRTESESESESDCEYGPNLNLNVDSREYNLRSKNPPVPAVDDDDDEDKDEDDTSTDQSPKRLQQPPAYINANLMKIKMEEDYVPIVTVKQEPPDADEINDAGVDESAAELNQHFINSIPVPTSGQMKKESEIDQQQQQQQQQEEQENVVVKVETAVNDSTETVVNESDSEKKKKEQESDKIAKLEEKIQKYSERVISLCREKREITETFQKEKDRLNLVIGEQKTEIQNLNSTITEQKDFINGLIDKINRQQNDIEEMNKKLKLNAENPTVENSDSNAQSSPKPKPGKIPGFPTKVLSHIFEYLDFNSLKNSRFVCRLWREEAGKILLSNFYIVCDDKKKCEKTLENWLKNSNPDVDSNSNSGSASKSIVPLKLCSKGKNAQRTFELIKKFQTLRNSITEWKLVQSDTKSLHEIIRFLPNLQLLQTKTLDLSPEQKWVGRPNSFTGIPENLQLLLKLLGILKKLKLDFGMGKETARHFFNYYKEFASVKSMEIHASGMHFVNNLLCQNINVKITRFTLDLHENFDMSLIRSSIIRISPSLQHVKFIVYKDAFRSSSSSSSAGNLNVEPWKDDWIIPVGFTSIQSVEIALLPQEISDSLQKFMLKSILISLTLPQIKKLAVGFIPVELEETVDKWNYNSHESARGRTLKSESLEELEIAPQFPKLTTSLLFFERYQNQNKIPGYPWPGLKTLKCPWNSQESFRPYFLSELKNLERLELNVWKWNSEKNTFKKDDENAHRKSDSASEFQLKDFKNLTSFCLKMPGNNQSCQDFANSLVQEELKFLKSLQYIQFHRVAVDAAPLKSALGSHVAIISTQRGNSKIFSVGTLQLESNSI